jgi:hypothetical protein
MAKIFEKLIFRGLHEKHAVQRGIWVPTQHYCENHTKHLDAVRTSQETHCLLYKAQPINAVWGKSLFIVRTIQNTHIQFVPHRKHITTPLHSPTG